MDRVQEVQDADGEADSRRPAGGMDVLEVGGRTPLRAAAVGMEAPGAARRVSAGGGGQRDRAALWRR